MKYYLENVENVFEEVKSNPQGLSSAEAAKRAEQYGKNKLAEAKRIQCSKSFSIR